MKEITVYTVYSSFTFIGKHRPDLEKKNWHYYEKADGGLIHFRKEYMVVVDENKIRSIQSINQSIQ